MTSPENLETLHAYPNAYNDDKVHGNYAVYGLINQVLFREGRAGGALSRGLDGFVGFDYSPDNVSLAYLQAVGGLHYTGLFPRARERHFRLWRGLHGV